MERVLSQEKDGNGDTESPWRHRTSGHGVQTKPPSLDLEVTSLADLEGLKSSSPPWSETPVDPLRSVEGKSGPPIQRIPPKHVLYHLLSWRPKGGESSSGDRELNESSKTHYPGPNEVVLRVRNKGVET